MTDQQVTDSLNTVNRDSTAASGALFNYLAKETARDDASATVATHIYGRLRRINEAGRGALGEEIFLDGGTPGPFANLQVEGLDACRTLLAIAEQDRLGSLAQDMTEQKLVDMLNLIKDAGVMKPADVTAIQALSQNQISRATELGLPTVEVAWVTEARA